MRTGDPAFDPEPLQPRRTSRRGRRSVRAGGATRPSRCCANDSTAAAAARERERSLAARDAAGAHRRAAQRRRAPALKTRHHGDYHLGQVLIAHNDFVIIDFEGEPARAARRAPRASTRRCATWPACCARSTTRAGRALRRVAQTTDETRARAARARLGGRRRARAFLAAYAEARDGGGLYARRATAAACSSCSSSRRRCTSCATSSNNRPDWVQRAAAQGLLRASLGRPKAWRHAWKLRRLLEPLRGFLLPDRRLPAAPRAGARWSLLAGWLLAKVVRFAIVKALRAVNFNVLTERAGIDGFLRRAASAADTTEHPRRCSSTGW